jgi:predicted MFS family arabinose efflux permease
MTITRNAAETVTAPKPRLVTRPLLMRFISVFGASTSFYLLLSVAPLYATASGGGRNAAGLATGALMVATVLGELATPGIVARVGYRTALMAGLMLLGVPALVLTVSGSLVWIALVCLLRGLGFAITIVAGAALTVSLIPAERRGEGLALAGVVAGVPGVVALPLGVWLAAHAGYAAVAVAAGAAALAAVVAVPGLPAGGGTARGTVGIVAGFRTAALSRPALVFGSTALAAGIIVTFLPLAVPSGSTGLVSAALFLQPAASTLTRWLAGRLGDRHGPARLVVPGLLVSAAGMFLTALTHSPVAVVAGVTVFGLGFGIAQNSTLTLMYARVDEPGYGAVGALWNFAYDAGMGVGALGFGAVAGATGYPPAFVLTAAVMTVALVPALRDRRAAASV